jgi:hypothetical protein
MKMTKLLAGLMTAFTFQMAFAPVAHAAAPYIDWNDQGIIYTAPDDGDAYYPSVLYDANGFGVSAPKYVMWYSDGGGGVFLVRSTDGTNWGTPTSMAGLNNGHHVQVVYDPACFGAPACGASDVKYKIWFWDITANIYSISAMNTAESADGINWTNQTALTQNPALQLVTGAGVGWNRGTYGPVSVFYKASASNTGTDPWDYRYVLYYDGTDGTREDTGLAYSADGLYWSAYTPNPVLAGSTSAAWDCTGAVYGTIYHDFNGYHVWYSGGGGDDGFGGCGLNPINQGIGYASSPDGKAWSKTTDPIFHINQAVSYRNSRVYAPSIINDGSGQLKMYYSALATGGHKKIGYAAMTAPQQPVTTSPGLPNTGNVQRSSSVQAVHLFVILSGALLMAGLSGRKVKYELWR